VPVKNILIGAGKTSLAYNEAIINFLIPKKLEKARLLN
jgi:hypothetical protein